MKINELFPKKPELSPKIYAYTDKSYEGLLKIGYTTVDVKKRIAEQYNDLREINAVNSVIAMPYT